MVELVSDAIFLYLLTLIGYFFILRLITFPLLIGKRQFFSIDPFALPMLNLALSFSLLVVIGMSNPQVIDDVNIFFFLTFLYLIGFSFPLFIKTQDKRKWVAENAEKLVAKCRKHEKTFTFKIAFYILIVYRVFLSSLVIGTGSAGARLMILRGLRPIAIVVDGLGYYVTFVAMVLAVSPEKKKVKWLLLILFSSLLIGSRGILIVFLINIFFIYHLLRNRKQRKFTIFLIVIVGIFSLVLMMLIWMKGNLISILIERIIGSGDIYIFALTAGNYQKLYGEYNWFFYLFHPYLKLFGLKGYDFPLGAKILGTAGLPVTGTGPNPHLSVLALVLFQGDIFASMIFVFAIGLTVGIISVLLFNIILRNNVDLFLKSLAFNMLFTFPFTTFADIGYPIFIILSSFTSYLFLIFTSNIERTIKSKNRFPKNLGCLTEKSII